MHVVVEQHIDDFMTSVNLAGAKLILEIPDKTQADFSYSTINDNYQNWNSTYTVVQSSSTLWGINTGNADVNNVVISSSANWNRTDFLSGSVIEIVQDVTAVEHDTSLEDYLIINHNGKIKGILLDPNINTIFSL